MSEKELEPPIHEELNKLNIKNKTAQSKTGAWF